MSRRGSDAAEYKQSVKCNLCLGSLGRSAVCCGGRKVSIILRKCMRPYPTECSHIRNWADRVWNYSKLCSVSVYWQTYAGRICELTELRWPNSRIARITELQWPNPWIDRITGRIHKLPKLRWSNPRIVRITELRWPNPRIARITELRWPNPWIDGITVAESTNCQNCRISGPNPENSGKGNAYECGGQLREYEYGSDS
jgi:hypothetical protein